MLPGNSGKRKKESKNFSLLSFFHPDRTNIDGGEILEDGTRIGRSPNVTEYMYIYIRVIQKTVTTVHSWRPSSTCRIQQLFTFEEDISPECPKETRVKEDG